MLTTQIIEPDWPAPLHVRAATTTRNGGTSLHPFDSLNLASHAGDEQRRVQKNRQLLISELGLPSEPVWLNQTHGRSVFDVANVDAQTPRADASTCTVPGRVCVVLTADCLPVLLTDVEGTRVAAVHCGWRGLAAGILTSAAAALDAKRRHLLAWLGPAISASAYEVDQPVRQRLVATAPAAEQAFAESRPGHWQLDLYELARQQLASVGVNDVFGGHYCTYGDPSRFYSYRRDGPCGRMASLIWLQR